MANTGNKYIEFLSNVLSIISKDIESEGYIPITSQALSRLYTNITKGYDEYENGSFIIKIPKGFELNYDLKLIHKDNIDDVLHDSLVDLIEDTNEVPERLLDYIDYEKLARDTKLQSGYSSLSNFDGELHLIGNYYYIKEQADE